MFASLIQTVKDIEAAVAAKDYETAARKAVALQQSVIDLIYGPPVMGASPDDHAALDAAVESCVAACHAANAPRAAGDAVGKIGDGKILDLLVKVLPLILALFGK